MLSRKELEAFDVPCQYIEGKKIVCEVVKSHLKALGKLQMVVDKIRELTIEGGTDDWQDGENEGIRRAIEAVNSLIEGKEE